MRKPFRSGASVLGMPPSRVCMPPPCEHGAAVGIGTGRMELHDEAIGDQIQAMASAQVYFNRPYDLAAMRRSVWGRGDGKFELGSMFSPYWQARLVDTPDSDRVVLVTR